MEPRERERERAYVHPSVGALVTLSNSIATDCEHKLGDRKPFGWAATNGEREPAELAQVPLSMTLIRKHIRVA